MPPMSDEPLSRAVLVQFHREVALPDLQRAVAVEGAGLDRHLTTQIERLWDALLGTREKLEVEYQLVRSGIGRLEERLERIERKLDSLAR